MSVRGLKGVIIMLVAMGVMGSPGSASADGNVELHGYVLGIATGRTTGLTPSNGTYKDFMLTEERLRLDLETWSDEIEAYAHVKLDAIHDALLAKFEINIREAFVSYTRGPFDFTLGRQIVTWGVGDLIFINDVFPKDWESFFLGRPLEYLKLGTDGLRTRVSTRILNFDILVVPSFAPDNLPGSDRFFMFDPLASIPARHEVLPERSYDSMELAVRAYRKLFNFDVSGYAYKGFWRSPGVTTDDPVTPSEVIVFYPKLNVYGASAQGRAPGGVLSLEGGYYESREDLSGNDPSIPNSQARFLAGYQRQMWEDFHAGVQYYIEIMRDYEAYKLSLPSGFPVQKEYRDTITLRLTQYLKNQSLRLSLFGFYSPNESDYLFQPSMRYKLADKLAITLGGNVFGGNQETTFLGQFDHNDNVYLSAVFTF